MDETVSSIMAFLSTRCSHTFTDDLGVPLVGGQIDAEGDELRVHPVLTAVEHHLHYLSVTMHKDLPLLVAR